MKLYFNINYKTKPGENVCLAVLENEKIVKFYPMTHSENGDWQTEIDYFSKTIVYKYQLKDDAGNVLTEEISLHRLGFTHNYNEYQIFDVWNLKNFPENYLTNKIFYNQFVRFKAEKNLILKRHTHLFRLEAPVYNADWKVVLMGEPEALGNWQPTEAVEMKQTSQGIWEITVEVTANQLVNYKYGLKNIHNGDVFDIEYGDNRVAMPNMEKNTLHIQADHFFKFKSFEMYHAAGVAVPIFSLRSEQGFGVGEFLDLKKLADWAKEAGLGMIQTLPINDTTANFSWVDSYPYAPISLYALHPQYISVEHLDYKIPTDLQQEYVDKKLELNALSQIDYEAVMDGKWKFLRAIFTKNKEVIFKNRAFKKFLKENEEWLLPYAAFCIQRDKYNTPDFTKWRTHKKYIPGKIATFFSEKSKEYADAMLHCWVQFQLHTQLKQAVEYIHELGISLKGDLPIGIYRYSVEAWTEPELYGMDFQAGAPPDLFSELGQNWGFPTYNWEVMKADGYAWWKKRFQALEQYFDAMRIDHILGFFRIWRTPISATQGILGYFYPAVPVTAAEFSARHIPFSRDRYCLPFINDQILWDYFGDGRTEIAEYYLNNHFDGTYSFKPEFDTQRKLVDEFETNPRPWAEAKLLALAANVLFLEEKRDVETVYHPRYASFKTDSYKYLSDWEKHALYELYNDYFFKRQDALWYQSGMEKLPLILNSSKMLICGEDLGWVPDCVPVVMDQLAILALKVQRMPPGNSLYYDPKTAGYMNVVTTSSHDSSTLRQWWGENRELTQNYFNNQLGQSGTAPWELHPALAEIIMKQHLYNEAMLAIFPIQEFFATDANLTNPRMEEERINDPAVIPHYWRYRMHLDLEKLIEEKKFNQKIFGWVKDSGRN